jgi:glycosyltransferase involved in cell wall biosynthesis
MSQPVKICHLITRMILGGAQENTLLTLQGLRRDTDWEIHLAYGPDVGGEGSLVEEARSLGIVIDPLTHLHREAGLWDFCAYRELAEYFSEHQFDLVHTHSSKAGVLGRIAAQRVGIDRIVHTIHGLAFDEYQTPLKNWMYITAERIAAENCDKIISVCDTMIEQALTYGVGRRSRMKTIYSGFPLGSFLKVAPKKVSTPFVIGVIARMFPLKGHEDLMKLAPMILKRWKDVTFRIVGDGPMKQEWEDWLAQNPECNGHVKFVGRVSPDQIAGQIAQMDMVLHLSWREGLARVIPQSMAASRLVCAYDIGGAAEIIEENGTGWIVQPGDFNSILRIIEKIRENPELATKVCLKARNRVEEMFSVEKMQEEILAVYRELGLRERGL